MREKAGLVHVAKEVVSGGIVNIAAPRPGADVEPDVGVGATRVTRRHVARLSSVSVPKTS